MGSNEEQAPEIVLANNLITALRIFWDSYETHSSFDSLVEEFSKEIEGDSSISEYLPRIIEVLEKDNFAPFYSSFQVVLATSDQVKKFLADSDRAAALKALADGYFNLGVIIGADDYTC
jgi:hypothetical protein